MAQRLLQRNEIAPVELHGQWVRPLCFDTEPTHAQILGLAARNRMQLAFLQEILASARENGARGPWMSSLALAIRRNRLMLPAWSLQRRISDKLRPLFHRPAAVRNGRRALQAEQK